VAGRKHFPNRTPPLEDDSLFARVTAVGSGKGNGNGAEFPLVSPLAASLKKYHAESDVSLFPLITGTYAPTAVRKMFAEMFANPPKDATPDHLSGGGRTLRGGEQRLLKQASEGAAFGPPFLLAPTSLSDIYMS
jgi:hypothetical protein